MPSTSKASARGPYARTRERRRAITRAALELVSSIGHEKVTVALVSAAAGVSEATVAYHFPTRDHLLVGALDEADATNTTSFLPAPSGVMDSAAFARFTDAATGDLNRIRLFTAQAANANDTEHPAHVWFASHMRQGREFFTAVLRQAQDAGRAHGDVDPERFSRQMMAAWDGLQVQKILDPSLDLAGELAETFRALARTDLVAAKRAVEELAVRM